MSLAVALSRYKNVPYVDGGRVVSSDKSSGLDCFGLARHALHYVFNGPLLESFNGVFRTDATAMTSGFKQSSPLFERCAPQAGALACCFHKSIKKDGDFQLIFHHIGICIDATNIMHTSSKHGTAVLPLRSFRRLANVVEFYRYIDPQNSENKPCR